MLSAASSQQHFQHQLQLVGGSGGMGMGGGVGNGWAYHGGSAFPLCPSAAGTAASIEEDMEGKMKLEDKNKASCFDDKKQFIATGF